MVLIIAGQAAITIPKEDLEQILAYTGNNEGKKQESHSDLQTAVTFEHKADYYYTKLYGQRLFSVTMELRSSI